MPLKVKDPISFDVLNQIDVRVGEILSVENVPDSRKLCQLLVDFGDFKRTILCGIQQERENPKEIEGKQALFVVNLAPRKMAGIMSEGIMYDIGYEDGIVPVLAIPEFKVPNGTRLG
ncbi:MAG: tRNA-binding protein [Erysipelotrichaceae bacterium]